jgi:hypothetical protein
MKLSGTERNGHLVGRHRRSLTPSERVRFLAVTGSISSKQLEPKPEVADASVDSIQPATTVSAKNVPCALPSPSNSFGKWHLKLRFASLTMCRRLQAVCRPSRLVGSESWRSRSPKVACGALGLYPFLRSAANGSTRPSLRQRGTASSLGGPCCQCRCPHAESSMSASIGR